MHIHNAKSVELPRFDKTSHHMKGTILVGKEKLNRNFFILLSLKGLGMRQEISMSLIQ